MRWGVMTFTVESLRLVRMISLIVVYLFSTCKYCKDVSTRPRPPFKFSTIIHTISILTNFTFPFIMFCFDVVN